MSRRDSILVSRTLYQLGMLTVVTAVVWVMIVGYQAAVKPAQVNVDKALLEPFTTNIDQDTVNELSARLKIDASIIEIPVVASSSTESVTIDKASNLP